MRSSFGQFPESSSVVARQDLSVLPEISPVIMAALNGEKQQPESLEPVVAAVEIIRDQQSYPFGLQIPSRRLVSDGFRYPPGLLYYGISEAEWYAFTKYLVSHINPHKSAFYTTLLVHFFWPLGVILAYPFKLWGEREDFQKSVMLVFEKIVDFDEKLFRPKGLVMRLDLPYDDLSMEYMDLIHRTHLDHLPVLYEGDLMADGPEKTSPDGLDGSKDMHHKENKRSLKHLKNAKNKMAKRPRIVIEPIEVLGDPAKMDRNGWTAWFNRLERSSLGARNVY
jgi:hypothetical protein